MIRKSIRPETRHVGKASRHPLGLDHPKVLLFVVWSIGRVTPTDNVGVFRIWSTVSIKLQVDLEYSFRRADATADCGLWCVNIKVRRPNLPHLRFAKTLRPTHRRCEPARSAMAPRHQARVL